MLIKILIILFVTVGIIIVATKKRSLKKDTASPSIHARDITVLTMADIVSFFKQEEVMSTLTSNANYIAVAIRQGKIETKEEVSLCVFDKEKSKVVAPLMIFRASSLDSELLNMFNGKDMMIIQ